MEKIKAGGILLEHSFHYLDHLAPLCDLLEIPLVVSDEELAKIAIHYYPNLQIQWANSITLPEYAVTNYDVAFSCMPRALFDDFFFFAQKLHNKRLHTIWCPHGNSDKGYLVPLMEGLQQEEVALVYGQKMIDFLKEKQAFSSLKAHAIIGNYRYMYYLRNKPFLDQLAFLEVFRKLPKAKKNLLYAPTWQDAEKSSSFLDAMPHLAAHLPHDWNLIVKLHPNIFLENDPAYISMICEYESHPQILFLKEFPPIYPLLEKTDIYLGDMSSIGYDFLTFNRPMFFFNPRKRKKADPGLYLLQCGVEIEATPDLYNIIESHLSSDAALFSEKREKVYSYTFGKKIEKEALQVAITTVYTVFPDQDLNFF